MNQMVDFGLGTLEMPQTESDARLYVEFFAEAVLNENASIEAGRPIYDDKDMIHIFVPGSRDVVKADAHVGHQQRFRKQWEQYKSGKDQTTSGTPLHTVPWLTKGQIAEMAAVNIKSVEQLADMPDNIAQKFMNHHALKQQASAFLEAAKGAAPLLKMQSELAKRDEQIAELQTAIKAMQAAKKG